MQHLYSDNTLIDSLIVISKTLYGELLYRLALLIEVCDLEGKMLRRIDSEVGASRLRLLGSMAWLPLSYRTTEAMSRLLEYGCGTEQFCALSTLVALQPHRAIKLIADYSAPISIYEAATLFAIMRGRGSAIAYSPLLASENRNLQLLGVYIVQHFSLGDAAEYLYKIVGSHDSELSLAALYAIGSIGGDIARSEVFAALGSLTPRQRNSIIGELVLWRYPLEVCHQLLDSEECVEFQRRVNSYKTTILCN